MKNYATYSMEKIATDPFFREWVLTPSPESMNFWENWITQNPEHSSKINNARALVMAVHERYKDDLSDKAVQHEIDELIRIASSEENKTISSYLGFSKTWLRIAALFLLISAVGIGVYLRTRTPNSTQLSDKEQLKMISKENTTSQEISILLSDGSVAILGKGSRIIYPLTFGKDNRSVFLVGEAFFDVSRDPERPFLVYANETVTKVLGTRFRVKAFEIDNTVTVAVKTGKVSVFAEKDFQNLPNSENTDKGIILTPNQQATFNRKEQSLQKDQITNPKILQSFPVDKDLVFDEQPVSEVLKKLASIYSIKIVFNEESLAHCSISTSFSDETLKQRINAICQAIDASYEVVDGQFVITSKGCEK